jgi:hypothetical protein
MSFEHTQPCTPVLRLAEIYTRIRRSAFRGLMHIPGSVWFIHFDYPGWFPKKATLQ